MKCCQMAYNEQGLLSVNEFKKLKMITELQKRFEADAYKQKLNYAGSAGIAAEQGFLAGIDFLQHLLQQTQCTTHVCQCQRLHGFTMIGGYSYCNTCGERC